MSQQNSNNAQDEQGLPEIWAIPYPKRKAQSMDSGNPSMLRIDGETENVFIAGCLEPLNKMNTLRLPKVTPPTPKRPRRPTRPVELDVTPSCSRDPEQNGASGPTRPIDLHVTPSGSRAPEQNGASGPPRLIELYSAPPHARTSDKKGASGPTRTTELHGDPPHARTTAQNGASGLPMFVRGPEQNCSIDSTLTARAREPNSAIGIHSFVHPPDQNGLNNLPLSAHVPEQSGANDVPSSARAPEQIRRPPEHNGVNGSNSRAAEQNCTSSSGVQMPHQVQTFELSAEDANNLADLVIQRARIAETMFLRYFWSEVAFTVAMLQTTPQLSRVPSSSPMVSVENEGPQGIPRYQYQHVNVQQRGVYYSQPEMQSELQTNTTNSMVSGGHRMAQTLRGNAMSNSYTVPNMPQQGIPRQFSNLPQQGQNIPQPVRNVRQQAPTVAQLIQNMPQRGQNIQQSVQSAPQQAPNMAQLIQNLPQRGQNIQQSVQRAPQQAHNMAQPIQDRQQVVLPNQIGDRPTVPVMLSPLQLNCEGCSSCGPL